MAMKLCPVCGKEYDDEQGIVCPFCGYNPEDSEENVQDMTDAVVDEEVSETDAQEASCEEADEFVQEETEENSEEESEFAEENDGNKKLKIVAAALGAVLIILALVLAYTKLIAPKKSENYMAGIIKSETQDTIKNVKKFTLKNLDGTFSDKVNYIYYTFTNEKVSNEITIGGEDAQSEDPAMDSAVDSAIDSAAQSKKDVETQTVEYDGTYTSGMTQKGIRQMVIINYIEQNGLAEEYMEYVEKNNILNSDFEGFIKEKGIEDKVDAYDSENNMSKTLAFEKTEGYFNFEEDTIVLFDENGTQTGEYKITEKGLINSDYYYEGEMPSKGDTCAVYSITMDNYGMTQKLSIRLYRDGYCVLEVEGDSASYQAGTYKYDEKGLYVNINGQNIFFHVTDSGICNELLTK